MTDRTTVCLSPLLSPTRPFGASSWGGRKQGRESDSCLEPARELPARTHTHGQSWKREEVMRQSGRGARREARSDRHTPPARAMAVRSATARREILGTPAATSAAGIPVLVSSLSTQAEYGAKGSQGSPGSQPPNQTRSTKPNPKNPHEENPKHRKPRTQSPNTPSPRTPIPIPKPSIRIHHSTTNALLPFQIVWLGSSGPFGGLAPGDWLPATRRRGIVVT